MYLDFVGERLERSWREVRERLERSWREVGERLERGWREGWIEQFDVN